MVDVLVKRISPQDLNKQLGAANKYVSSEVLAAGNIYGVNDTAVWTASFGSPTIAYDTVNTLCSNDKTNVRSIKVTGSGSATGGGIGIDLGVGNTIDLRNKVIVFRLFIHSGTGNNDPEGVINYQLFLSPAAGWNWGGVVRYKEILATGSLSSVDGTIDGWYEVSIACNSFEEPWTAFDMAAVRSIHIVPAYSSSSKTPSFTLDRVMTYTPPSSAGIYSIRIDLPTTSTFVRTQEVVAYMDSVGVKANLAISPWILNTGSYLTTQNVRDLESTGHAIITYAGNISPNNWADKTLVEKENVLILMHKLWKKLGVGQHAAEILGMSGSGGWNSFDEHVLKRKYLSVVNRGVYGFTNPLLDPSIHTGTLFIDGPASGVVPPTLAGFITDAEADKTLLVLGSHIATDNERDSFKESVDALVTSSLVNKTFAQIYQGT